MREKDEMRSHGKDAQPALGDAWPERVPKSPHKLSSTGIGSAKLLNRFANTQIYEPESIHCSYIAYAGLTYSLSYNTHTMQSHSFLMDQQQQQQHHNTSGLKAKMNFGGKHVECGCRVSR